MKTELESERDSVKDKIKCFHYQTFCTFQQSTHEETNPVLSSWNHWIRHKSQIRHQSLETFVWPFLTTLNRKKKLFFLKKNYQLNYFIS